jgi:hypothetical protein
MRLAGEKTDFCCEPRLTAKDAGISGSRANLICRLNNVSAHRRGALLVSGLPFFNGMLSLCGKIGDA